MCVYLVIHRIKDNCKSYKIALILIQKVKHYVKLSYIHTYLVYYDFSLIISFKLNKKNDLLCQSGDIKWDFNFIKLGIVSIFKYKPAIK